MGIVYFVVFAVLFIITLQNYYALSQPISLKFFHVRVINVPIGIWILLAFGAGYILGYIRAIPSKMKEFSKSREVSKLKKKLQELEKKIALPSTTEFSDSEYAKQKAIEQLNLMTEPAQKKEFEQEKRKIESTKVETEKEREDEAERSKMESKEKNEKADSRPSSEEELKKEENQLSRTSE